MRVKNLCEHLRRAVVRDSTPTKWCAFAHYSFLFFTPSGAIVNELFGRLRWSENDFESAGGDPAGCGASCQPTRGKSGLQVVSPCFAIDVEEFTG